jgi:membrane-bound inhibitor of C-type lysozyme/uncharacterized membrane protein
MVALLSACTPGRQQDAVPASARAESTAVYLCDGDYRFVARYGDRHAWLFLPSETIRLGQVVAASGARYSNGETTLWSRGDEAMLDVGGVAYRGCSNDRRAAIWEHAKLNGVDFRALGNEPGWVLEVSNGTDILFISDYGVNEYRFEDAHVVSDPVVRQTRYSASNRFAEIEAVLIGRTCSDTMSGEAFETTVSVLLDGRLYRGCGRSLH